MCEKKLPPAEAAIICLCGSTRFMDAFHATGWQLTLRDIIVLSVGVCKHAEDHGGEALGLDVAARLDELHKRKIDLAHFVFILNVGGYIGESTRSEIEYAERIGRPVAYLESCHGTAEAEDWDEVADAVRAAAIDASPPPSPDIKQRAKQAASAVDVLYRTKQAHVTETRRAEVATIIAAEFAGLDARLAEAEAKILVMDLETVAWAEQIDGLKAKLAEKEE